jgi:hypothetical protein
VPLNQVKAFTAVELMELYSVTKLFDFFLCILNLVNYCSI